MTTWDFARTSVTRLATRMDEFAGLRDVLRVLVFGSVKYPSSPWKGMSASEHLEAAKRHIGRRGAGVARDAESGEANLAHAVARLLMAMWIDERNA